MREAKNVKARLMLIFSLLMFGSIGIFVRNIDLSSGQIALVRGIIGTVFLFSAGMLMKKRPSAAALRRNALLLCLSGAAIGFNWILLFEAYKHTSVSTATLCLYLAPVFVVSASPFLLKEKMTALKWACIAGALFGMALVSEVFNGAAVSKNDVTGILCGVGAAVMYASILLMNRFFRDISTLDATMAQLFVASVVLTPYVLLTGAFGASPDAVSLVLLLIVGAVHTGFSYLVFFLAIKDLKAQTVAVMSYIDPITAIFLSALLLRERMSPLQLVGAALILGSTFVSEVFGNREKSAGADTGCPDGGPTPVPGAEPVPLCAQAEAAGAALPAGAAVAEISK